MWELRRVVGLPGHSAFDSPGPAGWRVAPHAHHNGEGDEFRYISLPDEDSAETQGEALRDEKRPGPSSPNASHDGSGGKVQGLVTVPPCAIIVARKGAKS